MAEKEQKMARLERQTPPTSNYIKIGENTFFSAGRRLNLTGLLIYAYLCYQTPDSYDGKRNKDCKRVRPFEISPKAIMEATGMARTSVHNGIKNLIEEGYLYPIDAAANLYQFVDILPVDKPLSIEENAKIEEYMSTEESLALLNKKTEQHLRDIGERRIAPNENYITLSNGFTVDARKLPETYKTMEREQLEKTLELYLHNGENLEPYYIK